MKIWENALILYATGFGLMFLVCVYALLTITSARFLLKDFKPKNDVEKKLLYRVENAGPVLVGGTYAGMIMSLCVFIMIVAMAYGDQLPK